MNTMPPKISERFHHELLGLYSGVEIKIYNNKCFAINIVAALQQKQQI